MDDNLLKEGLIVNLLSLKTPRKFLTKLLFTKLIDCWFSVSKILLFELLYLRSFMSIELLLNLFRSLLFLRII